MKPEIRLVDLWQRDGFSYLGHNPRGLSTKVKNRISLATWSPFPSPLATRCVNLAARLFPGRRPVFFRNLDSLANFLVARDFALPPADVLIGLPESVIAVSAGRKLLLVRPNHAGLLGSRTGESSPQDWLVPLLPTLDPAFGALLLIPADSTGDLDPEWLPPFELSQVAAEVWLWALTTVSATEATPVPRDALPLPDSYPADFPGFSRDGRYLIPRIKPETYPGLYRHARKQGVLFSPRVGGVSILPAWASKGEWATIRRVLELDPEAGGAEWTQNSSF